MSKRKRRTTARENEGKLAAARRVMEAVEAYLIDYDLYQTTYALHRLGGWNGDVTQAPPTVRDHHDRMMERFEIVYFAIRGHQKPDYMRVAEMLAAEAAGGDASNDDIRH